MRTAQKTREVEGKGMQGTGYSKGKFPKTTDQESRQRGLEWQQGTPRVLILAQMFRLARTQLHLEFTWWILSNT